MGLKWANNSESTLAAGINASVTTFDVATGHGSRFPTCANGAGDFFYVTLVNAAGQKEVIKVTRHDAGSDTFQVVERAADPILNAASATAYVFVQDDIVQMRIPAVAILTPDQTKSTTFQIDSGNTGPLVKNSAGTFQIRNATDAAYADVECKALTLAGALAVGTNAISGVTTLAMGGALSGVTTLAMGGALSGVTSLAMAGVLGTVTDLTMTGSISTPTDITASGTVQAEHLYSTDDAVIDDDLLVSGKLTAIAESAAIDIDNESDNVAIVARDHGTVTAPEVVNVVYGTGSPPAANTTPIGTLFIKYVA